MIYYLLIRVIIVLEGGCIYDNVCNKIKMKSGCFYSQSLLEIDEIYIEGADEEKFYQKAIIHDCVKSQPGSIKVKLGSYPNLIAEISKNGEKYVRSAPNGSLDDNLLKLPRV